MSIAVDVAIIGAAPAGLTAAAYLADAGLKVTVLEASDAVGGTAGRMLPVGPNLVPAVTALSALDPTVVKDFKLLKRGLHFAVRDLALVGLHSEDRPLAVVRDRHAATRAIAPLSALDATRFDRLRHELSGFGRAMRPFWWENGTAEASAATSLRRFSMTSTEALLDGTFESEAVKALFAFDALEAGLSPSSAGSSLALAWRAAQEMCGLEHAVAIVKGGAPALVVALADAAKEAGAEIRLGAPVAAIHVDDDRVRAAVLASGEVVPARVVLSGLDRRRTLTDFLPPEAVGFGTLSRLAKGEPVGEARLFLSLDAMPGFAMAVPASRFIVCDRLEAAVEAHGEARAGRLPQELILEVVIPDDPDPASDTTLLAVTVRPLPVAPEGGWPALLPLLVERVVAQLTHFVPGLRASVTGLNVMAPRAGMDCVTAEHVAASWPARLATPVDGLFLCGDAAEPVPSLSCRSGRIAAALVLDHLKRGAS